jgi:hypothetical protein
MVSFAPDKNPHPGAAMGSPTTSWAAAYRFFSTSAGSTFLDFTLTMPMTGGRAHSPSQTLWQASVRRSVPVAVCARGRHRRARSGTRTGHAAGHRDRQGEDGIGCRGVVAGGLQHDLVGAWEGGRAGRYCKRAAVRRVHGCRGHGRG